MENTPQTGAAPPTPPQFRVHRVTSERTRTLDTDHPRHRWTPLLKDSSGRGGEVSHTRSLLGMAGTSGPSCLSEALASGFLTCPICLERLSRPKILPCLHTYCHGCLEGLVSGQHREENKENEEEEEEAEKTQELLCPECRTRVTLPAGGVDSLKTNFFINGLLDLVRPARRASPTCTLCPLIRQEPARPAASRCLDCADDMCQLCAGGHRYSRLTHTHQVVDMEGYLSGRYDQEIRERQASQCKEHPGEALRFFCTPCAAPLCRECRLGPHLEHPCRTLAEAAEERRPAVEGLLVEVEEAVGRLAQRRADLEAVVEALEARQARIRAQVEQACAQAVEWLLAQQDEVLAQLSDYMEEQRKAWTVQRSELELQEQVASSTATFARRVLILGQEAEILSLEQMISERLKGLQGGFSWEPPSPRMPQLEIHLELESGRSPFCLEFIEEEEEEEEGQEEEEEEEVSRSAKKRRKKKKKKPQQQAQSKEEAPRTPCKEKPPSEQAASTPTEAPRPPPAPAAPQFSPRPLFSCSFWVKIPTDKRRPQVTGLCPFGSGELLVADEQNRRLKRFSLHGGEFKGMVPVPGDVAPFSVAALGSKVAFTAGSQLYLLDGEGGLAWQKALQRGQASHAVVAVGSDRLAVSVAGHLEVYDLEGRLVEKVWPEGTAERCLVFLARRKGGFVGSDWYRRSVVLFSERGELAAECREEQLGGCQPGAVCADPVGTVYVVLRELNKVFALSPSGQVLGTFLAAENGIDRPRVATVAREGRFAVALSNGTIHVFKIRYQGK